nr:probable DNA-3-methyladenine glycosylase 2 isoform X2 [Malus domestica]
MGEQTQGQTQAQPQTPTQAPTPAQPPPHHDSIDDTTIAQVGPTPTELSNAPSKTSSPPSKIPFRPRKIRKLSPDSADPASSLQIVVVPDAPKPVAATKASKIKTVPQRPVSAPKIVARPLSCEGEIETAIRYLRNADPLLAPLIDLHPRPTFDNFHTPFLALTRSILYQQLAYKAGTSIYTRFIGLCGGEACVVPETVLAQTPQQLRQVGISGRKASYLHDLARKYQNGILSDSAIVNMDDKSLFTMLTMVNGIGSWSVHMFMINSLHRPDVLPINDLGIRKGVQLLYNLEELPRPSQMEQLCEKWRPYRSVATMYMWRFSESNGAPSSAAGASLRPQQLQQQEPQQQQQQQHSQHPQQQQLMDSFSSLINIGACTWGP